MKRLILTLLLSVTAIHAHAQTTTPETLIPRFEGLIARTEIEAITPYKDGFVVAGNFSGTNDVASPNILYWDGSEWHGFGPYPDEGIRTMIEFEGDLWVAGFYGTIRTITGTAVLGPYEYLMRWDGDSWVQANQDLGGVPNKLFIWNDKLYATGSFDAVAGQRNLIKVWNGSAWETLPDQPNADINDVVVHDGKLVVSGDFFSIGGNVMPKFAQYDGTTWSPVGSGMPQFPVSIGSLDGILYAGTSAYVDGSLVSSFYKLDGSNWVTVPKPDGVISNMETYSDKIIAVFRNEVGSSYQPDYIAEWDGTTWTQQSDRLDHRIYGIIEVDDEIIVGGFFAQINGEWASGLGKIENGSLTKHSAPEIFNNDVTIYTAASKGGDLIVGGDFVRRGDRYMSNIALWDGTELYGLGEGFGNPVHHIVIFDEQIFAANEFVSNNPDFTMKSWDGLQWNMLPNLFSNKPQKMLVHDGHIYVGGLIFGDNPNRYLTRWDGNSWDYDLGIPDGIVNGIAVHDGALYVGGDFQMIGNTPINYIGKYENGTWTDMGEGLDGRVRYIYSIEDSIYISGDFTVPGVNSVYNAYVRDGNEWVRPRGTLNGLITDMDKVGDIVFATGYLAYDGPSPGGILSRWRDDHWTPIEFTLQGLIYRMIYHNGGLWIFGDISYNDGSEIRHEGALQYQVLDIPGDFLLSAPINSVVVDSLTPTYYWTASENATQYLFQIYENAEYAHPPIYGDLVDGVRYKPLISLDPGQTYYWRVRARSSAGETSWVNGSFSTSMTAVNLDEDDATLPQKLELFPAYPNPFNPTTNIGFTLPEGMNVSVIIHDLIGRKVATLFSGYLKQGMHFVQFDAKNLSSGVYFVRLTANQHERIDKITLIK